MNSYYPGSLVKLAVTVQVNPGNVDTDPSAITLTVTDPFGNATQYTPTHDGTGQYHYDFSTTGCAEGVWFYQYAGTGAAAGANAQGFFVQPAV